MRDIVRYDNSNSRTSVLDKELTVLISDKVFQWDE